MVKKIAYVDQRSIYPIINKTKIPYHASLKKKMPLSFYVFTLKIEVFNKKYIAKMTNPITKPQFLTIIKLTYTGIK